MAATDEELAKQLWALGDIARLKILRLLPRASNCEHGNNVSQLAEKLGMSQPTVSHHLRVLRQASLVKNKKMCRDVFYWVDPDQANKVLCHLEAIFQISSRASAEQQEAEPLLFQDHSQP